MTSSLTASSGVPPSRKSGPPPAFAGLVQSPLRAGLLRFLHANPSAAFDLGTLVQVFGQLRTDIENCLEPLESLGLAVARRTDRTTFQACRPDGEGLAQQLDTFLATAAQPATETPETVRRFRELIGRDEKMLLVFESIRTAAKSDIPLLILGPTGSGKEFTARLVHDLSRRRPHPFQAINCAALPDSLFESELFGYEKGAFTGAYDRKPGRIELSAGGTLLLDEIGDLSLPSQAKLLRVVEEHRVERLGGRRPVDVDFRLICATNRPLDVLVRDGRFRDDLYYRISGFAIRLPALLERPVDIPILAQRFLGRYCVANGLAPDAKAFTREALAMLTAYPWPGNIRELDSTVTRAALSAASDLIGPEAIQFLHQGAAARPREAPGLLPLAVVERDHIQRVLAAVGNNKKRAARILEISRETLYRKLAEYRTDPLDLAPEASRATELVS